VLRDVALESSATRLDQVRYTPKSRRFAKGRYVDYDATNGHSINLVCAIRQRWRHNKADLWTSLLLMTLEFLCNSSAQAFVGEWQRQGRRKH
jgi:hypothetical protein